MQVAPILGVVGGLVVVATLGDVLPWLWRRVFRKRDTRSRWWVAPTSREAFGGRGAVVVQATDVLGAPMVLISEVTPDSNGSCNLKFVEGPFYFETLIPKQYATTRDIAVLLGGAVVVGVLLSFALWATMDLWFLVK